MTRLTSDVSHYELREEGKTRVFRLLPLSYPRRFFFCFNFYQTWCLVSHRILPQNDRKMHGKGLPRERVLLLGRRCSRIVLTNVTSKSLGQYSVEPIVNEIVSLARMKGLDLDSNDIDGDCVFG
ncbi:hypothetical protein AVEN_100699-1 [Araneus ventricosus]|uniref:Uncharacterized protein n=1 Tax=Araneus ventricosus TaxID=182803 RepID=A0A4Y2CSR5_ARAVE|nr:hypothetical protein AVEN_100699-1 [Araneus ventricosus]